jgi:hypothetical protein
MSVGTNTDTARVTYRILAKAPGVVARLDVHMEAEEEEEVVVVVRAMSECMKTWSGRGSAQGGLAAQETLNA